LLYIDDRRVSGRKSSCDSTSDVVKRERHIATHHEDRRKRMRLVREKISDDNPMQVQIMINKILVYTDYYNVLLYLYAACYDKQDIIIYVILIYCMASH